MGAVRVGLVGAGPWAQLVHAPMLAAGPETELAGVWARRPEAAAELAAAHGVAAASTLDELLATSQAVAFAVPPAVQADLAVRAAAAGCHLLLEKPLAADVDGARRVVEAVEAAGVGTLVDLTLRFAPAVRELVERVPALRPFGGRALFVSAGFLGGPFATPWRLERGPLLDLGPHVVDLLEALLGPVVAIRAHGHRHRWVGIQLDHATGAASEAAVCARSAIAPHRVEVEVFGTTGADGLDCQPAVGPEAFAAVRAALADVVAGRSHDLDARHGLHLQELLATAEADLAG